MKGNHFKFLCLVAATTSGIHAGGNFVPTAVPTAVPTVQIQDIKPQTSSFVYIMGGVGKNNLESSKKASALTSGALDDSSKIYEIGAGYRFTDNIFATLAAQRNELEIADIDNLYGSLNYQLDYHGFKPYAGLVLGYSRLKWSKAPDIVHVSKDLTSDGPVYGAHVGLQYKLGEHIALEGRYQYLQYDHNIDIYTPGHETIEHKNTQNLTLGVQYEF